MQSGGVLGIKKRRIGNLSKGEYFVGKITNRMEASFVPLALALPNPKRKSVRLVPETVSKRKERSGIPRSAGSFSLYSRYAQCLMRYVIF